MVPERDSVHGYTVDSVVVENTAVEPVVVQTAAIEPLVAETSPGRFNSLIGLGITYAFMGVELMNGVDPGWVMGLALVGSVAASLMSRRPAAGALSMLKATLQQFLAR